MASRFSFRDYVNPDGTLKSDNVGQPIDARSAPTSSSSSGGDYSKSNEEYEALLKKYQSQVDASNPDSIRQLAEVMQKDGIPAEVSKDGLLIRVPGYDGGWVDPRQDKAFVEGRGGIRGWAFQPFYGSEDFDRLVAEGRNPHTGEFVGMEQARRYTRDSDFPIGDPRNAASGGGLPANMKTGSFDGGGRFPLASVMGEGLMRPWTTPFKAPTVTDDPGYKFRFDQMLEGLDRSAATQGIVRTGGYQKDLAAHLGGLASQEYQNAYDRAMGEYNLAYGIYDRNQANQFNRLHSMSSLGLNAAQSSNGAGYANAMGSTLTGIGNAQAAGRVGGAQAGNAIIDSAGDMGSAVTGYFATRRPNPATQGSNGPGMEEQWGG